MASDASKATPSQKVRRALGMVGAEPGTFMGISLIRIGIAGGTFEFLSTHRVSLVQLHPGIDLSIVLYKVQPKIPIHCL